MSTDNLITKKFREPASSVLYTDNKHDCGRHNNIITILSNREYVEELYNKSLFIRVLQNKKPVFVEV